MSLSPITEHKSPRHALAQADSGWRLTLRRVSILFKSRVVSLLVLAAVGGLFLGARGWPGVGPLALIVVAGGLAASGAAGLNEYIERGADALMGRTRRRPLVSGQVQARWVLWVGIAMVLVPVLATLPFNPALSFWLAAGAIIYVGIYTVWLKPRTLLNIVIGGAAGSAAVMSGGAAGGAWRDPAVIALALLVFLWTPSHFWSLAILYREDYAKARFPMLPVKTTTRRSAYWVLLHTGAAGLVALLMALFPQLGWVYVVPVGLATADMLVRNVRLLSQPTPRHARALFISSNLYLMVVLLAVCLGTLVRSQWPGL
ncbi:MAG: heme o synthase [Candidatus Promineifilaceae bacterium]|nr:heme o synthase [Candidatus Promineifilaceae bacterium]